VAAGAGTGAERRSGLVSGMAVVWTASGLTELLPVDVARSGDGEVTVEVLASVVSTGTERAQKPPRHHRTAPL
jgi:hypothetical protein